MSGVTSFWSSSSSRRGARAWPARTLSVAVATAAALVVTLALPAERSVAAEAPAPVADPVVQAVGAEPLVRPDGVSAGVTARASGERVEVEGLRDEFSSTFVNPDGSWTTESHTGQQRFRNAAGEWRPVDLTLELGRDGLVRPKGHPGGLTLSNGGLTTGGTELLRIAPAQARGAAGAMGAALPDGAFALTWPGRLPAPTLEGSKATYVDVLPGVDLVVEARRTGFEQYLVLKNRSAVLSQVVGGALAFKVGVRGAGISTRADAAGGVELVDAAGEGAGKVVWRVPPALAWDAEVDPRSGDPRNTSTVRLPLLPPGLGELPNTVGQALGSVQLVPDLGWLLAPGRAFPVTVDPTYAAVTNTSTFDTFTQSNIANTDQSGGTELKTGTFDGGATKARTYLSFNVAPFAGKAIQSATLSMYETYSYSCTPATVNVNGLTANVSTATRWLNQPGLVGTYGTASLAAGYSSSCPAARVGINVLALAQHWAGASSGTGTIAVTASESSNAGWKKFASLETAQDPYISFTYNRGPATPAIPNVDGALTHYDVQYSKHVNVAGRAVSTDPDGNRVKYVLQLHRTSAGNAESLLAQCTTALVASGTSAACSLGNQANNTEYWLRTKTTDELGASGAWSGWRRLRTAQTVPPAVTVTCADPYGKNSWATAPPAQPVSCTATSNGASFSGISKMTITVDGQSVSTPVMDYAGRQPASLTVPNTAGAHTITATATSVSGLVSPVETYTFGYGSASLTSPTGGEATNGKFAVEAQGPPRGVATSVTAKLKWRPAGNPDPTAGWNTDTITRPVTNLAGGAPSSSDLVRTRFVWDSNTAKTDTQGGGGDLPTRTPVRLDVQVCFVYGTAEKCTWPQRPTPNDPLPPPHDGVQDTITRMPHAFGNGFPTAEAGPGQVALFTGEWNTSVTDVTVPAYTGTLSLSRSHSTYDGPATGPDPLAGWPALPGSGVLGPGWTLGLDGSDLGSAELQVADSTHLDGTLSLIAADGTALVFAPPGGLRRTGATLLPPGVTQQDWVPVDEDTAASGTVLSIKDTARVSGTSPALVVEAVAGGGLDLLLRDEDGTTTTYVLQNTPTATTAGTYTPGLVDEPGSLGATVYSRDSAGRITRILAPAPPGVTCAATGTLSPGCRALNLSYGTTPSSPPSDPAAPREVTGQLKAVTYTAWNPEKAGGAGVDQVLVASYAYDSSKRLIQVTDTRAQLTTAYTYDDGPTKTPRIKTITPPGLAPFTLNYAPNVAGSGTDLPVQLASVDRGNPDPQLTANGPNVRISSFVYGIDPTTQGPSAGLPALGAADVVVWQQQGLPAYGAAVFSGATDPGTHDGTPTSATPLSAAAWQEADLQYTTADGWTVNTASYGAGDWQLTASDYDAHGNVIRSLDAGGIAAHKNDGQDFNPGEVSADRYATLTQYNAEEKLTTTATMADGTTVLPVGHVIAAAGTKTLHTWGPVREAIVDRDGAGSAPAALEQVRPHTRTILDEQPPNGSNIDPKTHQRYNLATTTIVGAAEPPTATTVPGGTVPEDVQVISVTRNSYNALEVDLSSPAAYGETSGWVHGTPTRVREIMNPTQDPGTGYGANDSLDIIRDTILDTEGRAIQTRQPSESGGTAGSPLPAGPGTMLTRYYSAAASVAGVDPLCGGKPEWAGLTCTFAPAGTTPAGSGGGLAATRTSEFTWFLTPKKVEQTSTESGSPVTRITRTTFDDKDRPVTVATELTVIDPSQSQPVPATTTEYDLVTGLPTKVSDSTGTVTTGYDAWGRAEEYTSTGSGGQGGSGTTETNYDADGRVESVIDPTGTTTYTYDDTDAAGRVERRGLPTTVTTTTQNAAGADGPDVVIKGAYDADGALVLQQLPGDIEMVDTYDDAGEPLARVYTGPDSTGPDGDADSDRDPWLGWSQVNDVSGRVVAEHTPNATAFDAPTGAETGAAQYHRQYTYDGAGRLTTVQDRTADPNTPGIALDDPNALAAVAGCTVRQYTFNRNGARTNLATHTGQAGQACPATTGTPTTTRAWTVDAADRTTAASRTTTGTGGTTTTGNYVFDALGRATTLPGVDVPGGVHAGTTNGNATLAYRADDSTWRIAVPSVTGATTGTLTQTYTYDSMGRRVTAASVDTSKASGSQDVARLVRHYADTSDNPTWTIATDADPANPTVNRTTTTRYLGGLGGGLAVTATKTAALSGTSTDLQVMLANHHGDITATTKLTSASGQWSTGTGINAWHDTDEYGNPRAGSAKSGTSAGYGWHGTAERSTDTPAGLTLMGARLYNPVSGLFTSTDPVYGGNDTTYVYPSDPTNANDLDGLNYNRGICWCAGGARGIAGAIRGVGSRYSPGTHASARVVPKPRYNKKADCKRLNANCYKGQTIGYTIYRNGTIYKFGISSVGVSRPEGQLSGCRSGNRYTCSYVVNKTFSTRWKARSWEYNKISSYRKSRGYCPPGQPSCK